MPPLRWNELLRLDRAGAVPLHQQIHGRVREAIERGLLRAGQRMASARGLADELGVSRSTVDLAYAQLAGEGYLNARGQAGTFVAETVPRAMQRNPGARSEREPLPRVQPPLPFQLGIPALDAFPSKTWARLASRCARALDPAALAYGDPAGLAALREAICAYLLLSRGIACEPRQILVTAGHRASLALIARAVLQPGAPLWLENPCHPHTRALFEQLGQALVPVDVDEEGLIVSQGLKKAPEANLAAVTPSHQAPLGMAMSLARRLELLRWASGGGGGGWIVEDDYDGEFRYAGPPLPALKSLDRHDRVFYAGSFSKVLFPALAMAYVVVPVRLVKRCTQLAGEHANGCPALTQSIVATFMAEGHFSRHLRRMRSLYAQRRTLLVQALESVFGKAVQIRLQAGGMHVIASFPHAPADTELAARAQRKGFACQALSARYAGRGEPQQGLLMGFTNIASQEEARTLAERLLDALS